MKLARVTSKGQITIPKEIREILKVKEGSKILFFKKGDEIVIKNAMIISLEKIQKEFEGEAERLNLESEEDVVKECTSHNIDSDSSIITEVKYRVNFFL